MISQGAISLSHSSYLLESYDLAFMSMMSCFFCLLTHDILSSPKHMYKYTQDKSWNMIFAVKKEGRHSKEGLFRERCDLSSWCRHEPGKWQVFGTALTTMYLINLPQSPQFPEKVSMKIWELRFSKIPYRVLGTGSDSWNPSSVEGSVRSGTDILSPLILAQNIHTGLVEDSGGL
jgi:hypothetical protein